MATRLFCMLKMNRGEKPEILLFTNQHLYHRGEVYFAIRDKEGLFIAPKDFENDLTLIIEPKKDSVRLMAGMFDNESGFEELLNQVYIAKKNIVENDLG